MALCRKRPEGRALGALNRCRDRTRRHGRRVRAKCVSPRVSLRSVLFLSTCRWPGPTAARADVLVELRGFEPVISAMRHSRALDGVPLPTAMAFLRSWANSGAGTIDRTP